MKPFRLLDTTTAREQRIDTLGKQYPTWLLWPAGRDRVSDAVATERDRSVYWQTAVIASRLLPLDADTVFVDVGANLGAVSVALGKLRPRMTAWAFEPARQSFLHLCTNTWLNALPNIRPIEQALAAAPGLLPLYLPDALDFGSATLRASASAPTIGHVRAVPFSEHEAGAERVHLMKIHVPGYTIPILSGAKDAILRWQTPLLLELPLSERSETLRFIEQELEYEHHQTFPDHFLAGPAKRFRGLLRRSRE